MHRIINETCPRQFIGKFNYISGRSRDGENCNLYTNKSRSRKEFFYLGAKIWKIIPHTVRVSEWMIKKFISIYTTLFLSTISNDESYDDVVMTGNKPGVQPTDSFFVCLTWSQSIISTFSHLDSSRILFIWIWMCYHGLLLLTKFLCLAVHSLLDCKWSSIWPCSFAIPFSPLVLVAELLFMF